MNNYYHEITCPEDRAIKHYLWSDYFHDSKIFDISFDYRKRTVILSLDCCRDYEDIWYKIKGSDEVRRAHVDRLLDKFIYYLTFSGTEYFHDERLPFVNDYINGRFKDTALLRKLCNETKLPLYHFRMQLDDGYIDIIFKKFNIRKKVGRVNLSEYGPYKEKKERWTTEQIHSMFENDAFENDFDRFLALIRLYEINDSKLLQYARNCLNSKASIEDSKPYAAYLLGKLGNESDLSPLLSLYFSIEKEMMEQSICRCSTLLPKRNILDAIELINYKHRDFK